MAATLTVTTGNAFLDGGITASYNVVCDWKSHTDGTVSLDIASTFAAAQLASNVGAVQPTLIRGQLVSVETIPGLKGDLATTLPTAAYDVTLLDNYGADVAATHLTDRSGTAAEIYVFDVPVKISSELTLTIAAAGDSKTGRLILNFME